MTLIPILIFKYFNISNSLKLITKENGLITPSKYRVKYWDLLFVSVNLHHHPKVLLFFQHKTLILLLLKCLFYTFYFTVIKSYCWTPSFIDHLRWMLFVAIIDIDANIFDVFLTSNLAPWRRWKRWFLVLCKFIVRRPNLEIVAKRVLCQMLQILG